MNGRQISAIETLTFDVSNDDHDEEAVVVGVVGVVNTGGDLTSADDLLQGDQHQLDRQESHTFIEEVQWAVKDEVPEFGFDRETHGGELDGTGKHQEFALMVT